mgnify:CR=1 FL=1
MKIYSISEKFKSLQGEGKYTGTYMSFIRFQGCSVGKKICTFCDTDFDVLHTFRGGGRFSSAELARWCKDVPEICLTGGEPLDQDLMELVEAVDSRFHRFHIETSGTVPIPEWMTANREIRSRFWFTVSPKPGYDIAVLQQADEVKIIVPGLGPINNGGWPDVDLAVDLANEGQLVYIQPKNHKNEVDKLNLTYCVDLIREYPALRLSVQMHKILGVQ